jgi:hypothetical protein
MDPGGFFPDFPEADLPLMCTRSAIMSPSPLSSLSSLRLDEFAARVNALICFWCFVEPLLVLFCCESMFGCLVCLKAQGTFNK